MSLSISAQNDAKRPFFDPQIERLNGEKNIFWLKITLKLTLHNHLKSTRNDLKNIFSSQKVKQVSYNWLKMSILLKLKKIKFGARGFILNVLDDKLENKITNTSKKMFEIV